MWAPSQRSLLGPVLACGLMLSVPGAGATPAVAHAGSHLPACLVGAWRDGHEQESTTWDGTKVRMHYSGGDVDHFFARGVDHDSWMHAKVLQGTYKGHRLTETIRGHLTEQLHRTGANRLRVTGGSWSKGSTNTYVYEGQHSTGYLNAITPFTVHFRCTAKRLTYLSKKGKVTGTETRISRTP